MSQTRAAAPASSPGCPVCCTPVALGDERCPTCLTYLRARPPADSFACAGARVITKVRDRLSWIMVPEAFEGLGLLAEAWRYLRWRAGRLGVAPPSRAYRRLDCPATRVELTRVLLAKLATCQLPALGVSCTPVAVQRGRQGLTVRHCHRLAGRDQVVRYALPPTVGHGFVVAGRPESVDESADGPMFAAVQFAPGAQPRERLRGLLVLASGLSSLGVFLLWVASVAASGGSPDDAPGLAAAGSASLVVGAPLWLRRPWIWALWLVAFVGAAVVAATQVGWGLLDVLRTAFDDAGYQLDLVLWLGGLCLCARLVGYWLSGPVRSGYGLLVPIASARASQLLPWRDRWRAAWGSPRGLVVTGTALLLVLLVSWLPRLLAHRWDFARADLAWRLGGRSAAIDVYDGVSASRSDATIRAKASALARQARLDRVRHELDAQPQSGQRTESSLDDLRRLVEARTESTESERRQTASMLLAVGERLVDAAAQDPRQGASASPHRVRPAAGKWQAPWRTARDTLRLLVTSFPEDPAAQTAANRSEWRLAWHGDANTQSDVPVCARRGNLQAHRVDGRLEVDLGSHECQQALKGRTFLVVALQMAHLGRTKQELLAGFFTVSTPDGRSWPCVGLQEQHGIPVRSLATGEQATAYEMALVGRKVGEGITIGPDLLPATLVFEVPEEARSFSLRLRGRPLAELTPNRAGPPSEPSGAPGADAPDDSPDGPGKPGEGRS